MAEPAHILVVDDDPDTRDELHGYLTAKGYRVSTADGGVAMRQALERQPADLIILDLMMPGEHGLSLVGELRKTSDVGIILLTGTGDDVDHVVGLELGADDFMSKPCNLRQLLARVRTILRRVQGGVAPATAPAQSRLGFEGWVLDLSKRRLTSVQDDEVALTTAEFDLLAGMAMSANRVLSRDRLLEMIHGREWSPLDRSVDNLVSRLRRKVEADAKAPKLIKTVRGVGYVFTPKVERQ